QDECLARTGRRHFPLHVREPSPDVRFDDVRELYGPPSRKNPGVEQGPLPRCRFLLDDTPGREPLRERPKGLRAGTGIDVLPAMKVRADRRVVLLRGGLGGEWCRALPALIGHPASPPPRAAPVASRAVLDGLGRAAPEPQILDTRAPI